MVIASIDLMQQKAVQLRQGKDKVLERDNPFELAREFDRYGEIAVIDLDAALRQGSNRELITRLLPLGSFRVGGGIRAPEDVVHYLSHGAKKIILGSSVFTDDRIQLDFLESILKVAKREELIVAIDAWGDEIVTQGWKHHTGLNLFETARVLSPYVGEFLFTCVEQEGTMQGIPLDRVKQLREVVPNLITAAGGVHTLAEIEQLALIGCDVQLGMALYTGAIRLSEAFIAGLDWSRELIPTVTQDESGRILTLAYSNCDSLRNMLESGQVWFYSRSRQKLWQKGESSGHTQNVVRLRADCDRDTLLVTVKPHGPACHTNQYSCFDYPTLSWKDLYEVILNRIQNAQPGSYTARLNDTLLREKIMEEADELCEAKNHDEIVWESADLLYFVTVLMARSGVSIDEIWHELARRRRK